MTCQGDFGKLRSIRRREGAVREMPLLEILVENWGLAISGVVLSDHLKSLDWKQRKAELAARVPPEVISEVLARLAPLLGFGDEGPISPSKGL